MPKTRTFDFVVSGSPAEVAARLEQHTRRRMFHHQSSVLGKGELGGTVSESGFSVSDDESQFFRKLLAVAKGSFEDRGDGTTRVHGVCAMPTAIVWAFRGGSLVVPVFLLFSAFSLFLDGGGAAAVGAFSLFGAILAMIAVLSIGWNVSTVEAGVDPLIDRLQEVLRTGDRPSEVAATTEQAAQRRPQERALEG